MADVLCTNNAIGCPSGGIRPTSAHPTQTATSYTQDTQNKQRLVNWQDNPNYSVITQAQARYEYNSQCKEQILFYISRMNVVAMREHNKTSTNFESTFSSLWGQLYLWKIFKGMTLVFSVFSLLTANALVRCIFSNFSIALLLSGPTFSIFQMISFYDFSVRLLIKSANSKMCYFGYDEAFPHTMSRPRQYLIGNRSQLISLLTLNNPNPQK